MFVEIINPLMDGPVVMQRVQYMVLLLMLL